MKIFINGAIEEEKKAVIFPFNESYMYGYGVFETLRTYNGKIFQIEDHIDRLFHSAELIQLNHSTSKEDLIEWTKKTFQSSGLPEARIKIILTETEHIIWPQELKLRPEEWYKTGIKVVTYNVERVVPEAKNMNCLPGVLAQKWAKKNDVYESLLIDKEGVVREGSYSNLFWIKDAILYTTKTMVLKGITRNIVLDIAQTDFEVKEEDWKLEDILSADEVFITNTTSEILPVVQIDDTKIQEGKVGEGTKKLMESFHQ